MQLIEDFLRYVFGPIILVYPDTFIEVPVPSQETGAAMYLCVKSIDFATFYDFDI